MYQYRNYTLIDLRVPAIGRHRVPPPGHLRSTVLSLPVKYPRIIFTSTSSFLFLFLFVSLAALFFFSSLFLSVSSSPAVSPSSPCFISSLLSIYFLILPLLLLPSSVPYLSFSVSTISLSRSPSPSLIPSIKSPLVPNSCHVCLCLCDTWITLMPCFVSLPHSHHHHHSSTLPCSTNQA